MQLAAMSKVISRPSPAAPCTWSRSRRREIAAHSVEVVEPAIGDLTHIAASGPRRVHRQILQSFEMGGYDCGKLEPCASIAEGRFACPAESRELRVPAIAPDALPRCERINVGRGRLAVR
jgi:hypothetical protein